MPELTENGCYRFQWRGERSNSGCPGATPFRMPSWLWPWPMHWVCRPEMLPGGIGSGSRGNMRSEVRLLGSLTLLVDCYNANPQSLRAALDLLTSFQNSGPRVAVLGSMLELGEGSRLLHRQVLEDALSRPLDLVVATGLFAEAASGFKSASDGPEARCRLRSWIEAEEVLLESLWRG